MQDITIDIAVDCNVLTKLGQAVGAFERIIPVISNGLGAKNTDIHFDTYAMVRGEIVKRADLDINFEYRGARADSIDAVISFEVDDEVDTVQAIESILLLPCCKGIEVIRINDGDDILAEY